MRLPAYDDLSEEQDEALALPLKGRYLIGGAPGTGKTVVALYRASRMKRSEERVRLLMYSNLLARYTTASGQGSSPVADSISTYHSWFPRVYHAWTGHRRVPDTGKRFSFDWNVILDHMATRGAQDTGEFLLVDEGQDLPKELYLIIRHFVTSNLTVFADENQRIMSDQSTLDEIVAAAGISRDDMYLLTRNFRNSRQIHDLAAWFHRDSPSGIAEPPVREGNRPAFLHASDLSAQVDYIRNYERLNADQSIGVLVRTRQDQMRIVRCLQQKGTENEVMAYNRDQGMIPEFGKPGITVLCYPSAKGLEFDAVFLPSLEYLDQTSIEQADTMMRLYVMVTRARNELFLMQTGDDCPLCRAIPDHLIRRIAI